MFTEVCWFIQKDLRICHSSFQALWQKWTAYYLPSPLNKATAFCCRDSSLTSSGLKCGVLLFGNCGESYCDGRVVNIPSPSKAHVQTAKAGDTSGAQVFENVEQFGHRYLNRADSEKSPRLNPESKHISATQRACRSIRNYWRRVRSWCCDCAKLKNHTSGWQGAVSFPFPSRPTINK